MKILQQIAQLIQSNRTSLIIVDAETNTGVVTRHRLDVKEVETQPGTFGDPIMAVENLPGVAVVPFEAGGIAMRGAAPDES